MMRIEPFFDPSTSTFSYLIFDEQSLDAVAIDPVLDFDAQTLHIAHESLNRMIHFIETNGLSVHWVLDTHVHADHLSGSWALKKQLNCKSAIGARIHEVQQQFGPVFNRSLEPVEAWDRLLRQGDSILAGTLKIDVQETPGHTPACLSYIVGDAVFVGDALFMPELGCGRCDFPGGSARQLFRSVTNQIYSLPKQMKIFTGHDYPKNDQQPKCQSTVEEQSQQNIMINARTNETDFVHHREARDRNLPIPKLLYFSMQVNIEGGRLPPPESNGQRYMKLPIQFMS